MTTLKSIIEKNEEKLIEKCRQLLIKDFCHLQYWLDAKLCTNKFIHNKLINACQDILACQYPCFKPVDSLTDLINDLCSSIITFQKSNSTNTQTQVFFTDWCYYNQYHPSLSLYAWRDRGNNREDNKVWVAKKRCFVSNKKGCWSSRHTRKKREDLKNKFKKWFSQEFDKRASQYIAEYEEIDHEMDDDTKSIDDIAEALMIDMRFSSLSSLNQDNVNTDIFITSFGIIYSAKTITSDLVNHSFEYAIIGNNPNFNCHKSDPFTYIT